MLSSFYTGTRDYIPAPELDQYDSEDIDEEPIDEDIYKRMRDRMAAEEALDALDARRREREDQLDEGLLRDTAFDRQEFDSDGEEDEDIAESDRALNLEAFDSPLREWIAEERTRREIHRRFKKFLLSYYVGIEEVTRWIKRNEHQETPQPLPSHLKITPAIYPPKIRAMCASNLSSLEVSYGHLAEMQSLLAIWLTDVPKDMLEIFDEVLLSVVTAEFPHYKKVRIDALLVCLCTDK